MAVFTTIPYFFFCAFLAVLYWEKVDCGQDCLTCGGIKNITECQQFTTCDDNEACYMHKYRLSSGDIEFDLGCGSASVCRGPKYGSMFGKRTDGRHLVCLSCCNETALCNKKISCPNPVTSEKLPRDCSEIENVSSGVRFIYPTGATPGVQVNCDVSGAEIWTVIQRRIDGCTDFYRNWDAYKSGFGDVNSEYWLGNANIHEITSHGRYKLRIDLGDFDNQHKRAEYAMFHVGDEASHYQLSVTGYTGTAGDCMTRHNGHKFSTFDSDNDSCIDSQVNCAVDREGAWWYDCCYDSNLNGKYLGGVYVGVRSITNHYNYTGMNWDKWRGESYSLKSSKMMITKY